MMKPMEVGDDPDIEARQTETAIIRKGGYCNSFFNKRVVLTGCAIVIGIFVTMVIIPNDSSQEIEVKASTEKKEMVKKVARGERYPYKPENWCLNHETVDDFVKIKCSEKCENPLAPKVQLHYMVDWYATHSMHMESVKNAPDDLDVVFLGDQYFEGFTGTHLGKEDEKFEGCKDVFNSYFSKENGAPYEGLSLGIADDRTNHVLWRLQNGELPSNLTPKVFWLQIGTNNFRQMLCSDEVVSRGVIRVVEELLEKRPESKIVINGLLPKSKENFHALLNEKSEVDAQLLNIWDGIQLVNERLQNYTEQFDDNVYYVDSSDLFIVEDPQFGEGDIAKVISKTMMVKGDITVEGYEKWGEQIVQKLQELIS